MTIDQSYRLCEQIARTRARNFYFSFLTLPTSRRRAMCAVYAFMRYCDDLADDASIQDRAGQLQQWRKDLWRLETGDTSAHPMMPAFYDTIARYEIPLDYFEEVILGAEMDLSIHRYDQFEELYRYCYRVASVVGLTCLKIFGYQDEAAVRLGEWCGIAFQLTNIIRDVREDASEGRIYLPQEDLRRFGCPEALLSRPALDPAVRPLLEFQAARAQEYYEKSLPLLSLVDPESQASLSAMICIYHGLLRRIQRQDYDVFSQRISLPISLKLAAAGRCWLAPHRTLKSEIGAP